MSQPALMTHCVLVFLTLGGVFAVPGFGQETKSPEAIALLRGVESARSEIHSLNAELALQYHRSPTDVSYHFKVEQRGNERRVEHLSDSSEPSIYLVQNDIVSGFRRKTGEDLQIYGILRSTSVRGDVAFDPRLIGLSDIMPTSVTLHESLWLDKCESASVLADEGIGGVLCRKVVITTGKSVSQFWISDSSFRVYRRTFSWPGGSIEIESDFSDVPADQLLPVKVTAKRVDRNVVSRMSLSVIALEVNVPIPQERFTIGSFDLPINTMINDYRINRITGYWNGKSISDLPAIAEAFSVTDRNPDASNVSPLRFWVIAVNVIAFVSLACFFWWFRSVRTH